MGTRHSLAAISLEMERQKRDAQSRQEQDRVGRQPRGLCPRGSQHGLKGLVRVEALEMLVCRVQPFLQDSQLKEVAAGSTLVRLLV